jgi:RNA polymerase sigma factor (sigma-70 family)
VRRSVTQAGGLERVVGVEDGQGHPVTRPEHPDTDAAAFCTAEWPQLVRALSLYVGDPYLPEELAQQALERACRQWGTVSKLDSPGGWTWRVATNLANSHFRRRRAAPRAQHRLDRNEIHRDPDSSDALAVRTAVAALPERQRTALVLRHFLELSAPETAAWMGITSDAVRSLTKRATAALREQLGEDPAAASQEAHDGS